ncbi:hypothetical protein FCM35_KLT14239 [Carex littledalei]|uniref:Uncharacterized protein n=1 Tax=Carex littledalei TaxID=544730 RepID=A0A833QEG1_9POAL|nr:hypothetical protein FCM35_KLT14239 [Carex littledalei]
MEDDPPSPSPSPRPETSASVAKEAVAYWDSLHQSDKQEFLAVFATDLDIFSRVFIEEPGTFLASENPRVHERGSYRHKTYSSDKPAQTSNSWAT